MTSENLDVAKFQKRWNPIRDNCWGLERPITQNDIEKAVKDGNLFPPVSGGSGRSDRLLPTLDQRLGAFHIARIAWFVVHGWDDEVAKWEERKAKTA